MEVKKTSRSTSSYSSCMPRGLVRSVKGFIRLRLFLCSLGSNACFDSSCACPAARLHPLGTAKYVVNPSGLSPPQKNVYAVIEGLGWFSFFFAAKEAIWFCLPGCNCHATTTMRYDCITSGYRDLFVFDKTVEHTPVMRVFLFSA